MPRLIGTAKALELCLTGELIDAAEAFRLCLVNRVVPVEQLMGAAEEIATKICLGAPLSVIAIKEAITKGVELPIDQGLQLESELGFSPFNDGGPKGRLPRIRGETSSCMERALVGHERPQQCNEGHKPKFLGNP